MKAIKLFPIFFFTLLTILCGKVKAAVPTIITPTSSGISDAHYVTGSTSAGFSKPAIVYNGDVLLAYIHFGEAGLPSNVTWTPSAPADWVQLVNNSANLNSGGKKGGVMVYYKVIEHASSEPANYNFTLTSSNPSGSVVLATNFLQIRGVNLDPDYFLVPGTYAATSYLLGEMENIVPSVTALNKSLWIASGYGEYYSAFTGNNIPVSLSVYDSEFTNQVFFHDDGSSAYTGTSIDYKTVLAGATGTMSYGYYFVSAGQAYDSTSILFSCENGEPLVTDYYPLTGSISPTYAPRISKLKLTFNEPIQKNLTGGPYRIYIKRYADDTTLLTLNVTDSIVEVDENIVRLRIPSCLVPGEQVYVLIDNGAFKDICDNLYTGISNKDTWKFKIVRTCNEFHMEL